VSTLCRGSGLALVGVAIWRVCASGRASAKRPRLEMPVWSARSSMISDKNQSPEF
jgi:hypothetical protein